MSYITDVVIFTETGEPGMKQAQDWVRENTRSDFSQVDEFAGGNKAMQCDVWAGAFNYFPKDDFLAALRAIKEWEHPDAVQVLFKGENDSKFEIHDICVIDTPKSKTYLTLTRGVDGRVSIHARNGGEAARFLAAGVAMRSGDYIAIGAVLHKNDIGTLLVTCNDDAIGRYSFAFIPAGDRLAFDIYNAAVIILPGESFPIAPHLLEYSV